MATSETEPIPVTQDLSITNDKSPQNTTNSTSPPPRKRSRTNSQKRKKNIALSQDSVGDDIFLDILDGVNAKTKAGEKRSSAQSHFNYFLSLRNHQLAATGKPTGVSSYDALTFQDVDSGPYIGEFCNYIAKVARQFMNPKNQLISYLSATGYMGSIKNHLLDRFNREGVPNQLKDELWKRKLVRVRSIKCEQAKARSVPMFGSKEAASDADRMGIIAICIWTGNLMHAEFLNLFQSMVMNCGRGSEIGVTKLTHLNLRCIKEDYGLEYETMEQYVNRSKTEGK